MGLVQAAYLLINQHYKIEPRLLMLWRGFGTTAVLLPFALWLGAPASPLFYALCIATGLCVGVFDRLVFEASAKLGAGVVSRLLALTIPVAFVLWLLLHPGHLAALADKRFIALLPVALLGLMGAALLMRRDPLSRAALLALAPVLVVGGSIDVLNKSAMHYASGWQAYVAYGCITAFISGLLNLLWPTRGAAPLSRRALLAPHVVRGGLFTIAVVTFYLLLKTSSLADTPNPAFVSALNLTAPVWVLLWNRWQGVRDASNLWAGFACVISALLLVLATL